MEEKLGVKYTEGRKTEFAKSFRESGPASPVFFILSPGVDPLKDVESLGTVITVDRWIYRWIPVVEYIPMKIHQHIPVPREEDGFHYRPWEASQRFLGPGPRSCG